MQVGIVVGTAISTVKHPSLNGQKLLIVQPYLVDGRTPDGEPVLVIDGVGAGRGENVLITNDSKLIRTMLSSDTTPVRWGVMGIADE
jgi:ethanolamine utilization protein EutN